MQCYDHRRRISRALIATVAATLAYSGNLHAQALEDRDTAEEAISLLQVQQGANGGSFVVQGDLDPVIRTGGGGACASSAGVDALQTLRVMSGEEVLANPHQAALAAFKNQPALLDGRVTNEQFVKLLQFYDAEYLDDAEVAVDIKCTPTDAAYAADPHWSAADGPELPVAPGIVTVLSYTVTEANGHVRGRHFVLLKQAQGSAIVVLDPTKPHKDFHYVLDEQPEENGSAGRVRIVQPAGAPPRALDYELNTVFTLTLRRTPASEANDRSVEKMKSAISQTADELRGSPNFTSPLTWREKTAACGLPGLDLPAAHGGSGWPATKMVEVFRHAGRLNLNFRDVVGGAHARALLKSHDPEVLSIVRQVAEGRGYMAIAITEPTAGSDIPAIKSTSRRTDGGYVITGEKRFNARLDQASHVIIFTQGTTGVAGRLNVFVLPIGTPGLHIERLEAHGLKGNSYGGLTFKDVFVPESHRIGEDGEGLRVFFEHFLYWRLMQTAAAIGTGEDALMQMAHRLKTREAFDGKIGRFTHLQQPLGQHWIELQMAHALALQAAELIDRGEFQKARPLICGLKAEGVETALDAVDAAMRAFGGEGYSKNVDLGDRLSDLQGLRIADGTTDVMRMEVVRHTFGEELWKMAVENQE